MHSLIEDGDWDLVCASLDSHPHDHISFASRNPPHEAFTEIQVPLLNAKDGGTTSQMLWYGRTLRVAARSDADSALHAPIPGQTIVFQGQLLVGTATARPVRTLTRVSTVAQGWELEAGVKQRLDATSVPVELVRKVSLSALFGKAHLRADKRLTLIFRAPIRASTRTARSATSVHLCCRFLFCSIVLLTR